MQQELKKQLLYIAVMAISLHLTITLLQCYIPEWINTYTIYTNVYMAAITALFHFLITKGNPNDAWDRNNYFMAATSVKLLLAAGWLFFYFLKIKSDKTSFLTNYFILYFVYTFFEIKTLLLSLQPHSKSGRNT